MRKVCLLRLALTLPEIEERPLITRAFLPSNFFAQIFGGSNRIRTYDTSGMNPLRSHLITETTRSKSCAIPWLLVGISEDCSHVITLAKDDTINKNTIFSDAVEGHIGFENHKVVPGKSTLVVLRRSRLGELALF